MERIIQEIEVEIARLREARALLAGEPNARKVGMPGKRKRSAATKAKMPRAQKARGRGRRLGSDETGTTWRSRIARAWFFGSSQKLIRCTKRGLWM
jgi:hypothetical protein